MINLNTILFTVSLSFGSVYSLLASSQEDISRLASSQEDISSTKKLMVERKIPKNIPEYQKEYYEKIFQHENDIQSLSSLTSGKRFPRRPYFDLGAETNADSNSKSRVSLTSSKPNNNKPTENSVIKIITFEQFNTLPSEMQIHILSFTSPRTFVRLKLVSKYFKELIDNEKNQKLLWRDINLWIADSQERQLIIKKAAYGVAFKTLLINSGLSESPDHNFQ